MHAHYDFDTVIDRRGTNSEKWNKYQDPGILPMWLADMDFRSPPAVMEAMHERVDHGIFGYTDVPDELIQVVLHMLQTQYRWHVEAEEIVWLPSLLSGLNVACRTVGEHADQVLTATPIYPPFLSTPGHLGRVLKIVPLVRNSGRWTFDLDRMARAITDRTRLLLLCNPHNPVGTSYSEEELGAIAELCEKHDVTICSDEIYCSLILEQGRRHVPTATLDKQVAQQTITLMSPGKTFNLAGLECAFAVVQNADLRQRFCDAMDGIVPHVNIMGLVAALAAYRDGWEWHAQLLEYLRVNRDLVTEAIGRMPRLSVSRVEAAYVAWIDARELEVANPAEFMARAGVGLADGARFGGPGFLRLSFGCPRATLQEALRRIAVTMESHGYSKHDSSR
jgi:cystathionine beta-lyase